MSVRAPNHPRGWGAGSRDGNGLHIGAGKRGSILEAMKTSVSLVEKGVANTKRKKMNKFRGVVGIRGIGVHHGFSIYR